MTSGVSAGAAGDSSLAGMSSGISAGDVGQIVGTGVGDLDDGDFTSAFVSSAVFDEFAAVSAIAVSAVPAIAVNHGTPNTQRR